MRPDEVHFWKNVKYGLAAEEFLRCFGRSFDPKILP